jgi:hypothetical protein
MVKEKISGKSEVHLKRTIHKLQPNEELRIIIGKVTIGIRIVSAKPRCFTTP